MCPPPPPPPSAGFDTSRVSPSDAVVALRSLRRRFAEAFDQADNADDLARLAGTALSPVGHAAWTATALETIGAALRQVLTKDDADVTLPLVNPPGPEGDQQGASAVLARLGEVARTVADTMAETHGDDWSRVARSNGDEVSALDIARLGVRIGVEHLRAAEQMIAAGRG